MTFDTRLPSLFPEERKKKQRKPIRPRVRQKILTAPKKCVWCRKQPSQQIHHIDGNSFNNNSSNLIGLCGTCHIRATRGDVSKKQLWKGLGIKPKPKLKRRTKPRRKKQSDIFGLSEVKIPKLSL